MKDETYSDDDNVEMSEEQKDDTSIVNKVTLPKKEKAIKISL